MLALIVAHTGPVRDGLVAILDAMPEINKIVQVEGAQSAWEFVQVVVPEITLIYAKSLTEELATLIDNLKRACSSPILAILGSEADRQTAVSYGADIVVMEGLPPAKLANHITTLLQQKRKKTHF